jgi:pimeloyl-ACP methyl ester carboxylesterase
MRHSSTPPASLRKLAGRFDLAAMDIPGDRARIRLAVDGGAAWDAVVERGKLRLEPASDGPDAILTADASSWERIADDVRGGMDAFQAGRLTVRRNLHLGVGLLAATSGLTGPGRLVFSRARTRAGDLSYLAAGEGEPVVMLHGLGGTKASFLPTVAALAGSHRAIAVDLPGFGDSAKPLGAAYDAPFFARAVTGLLDELGIERAHIVGNSMGGRVALELGLSSPERVSSLVLLAPSLAWLRDRPFAGVLRFVRPELGLLQVSPRRIVEPICQRLLPGMRDGWAAAGIDEFLRAYLTPRGRAAFYAAARQIYLEAPEGDRGFWPRLRTLEPPALFVWGREDRLVPLAFARHVAEALPAAEHLELDCGHVPQVERPRETHAAVKAFLAASEGAARRPSAQARRRAAGRARAA